jgi:hypothetical protein
MGLAHGTNIVKDGLVFYVDAANQRSCVGSTSTTKLFNLMDEGTVTGSFGSSGIWDSEKLGNWDFDSISQRIVFNIELSNTSSYIDLSQDFTFSIWVKCDDYNLNSVAFGNKRFYTQDQGIQFGQFASPKQFHFQLRTNSYSTQNVVYSGKGIDDGTFGWFNFTVFTDGNNVGNLKGYVNGEFKSSGPAYGRNASGMSGYEDHKYALGGAGTSNTSFTGTSVAIVQGYNRALSPAEIKQNYNALKGRFQ